MEVRAIVKDFLSNNLCVKYDYSRHKLGSEYYNFHYNKVPYTIRISDHPPYQREYFMDVRAHPRAILTWKRQATIVNELKSKFLTQNQKCNEDNY